MVQINNDITETSCFLYGPKDGQNVLIGEIKNELAFYDVRVQIKDQQLEGYYILFKGQRHYIESDGRINNFPRDLFPKTVDYLMQL